MADTRPTDTRPTLYVLDAHSLIYQVFHGMPEMTGPDGRPTHAVFGFVRDLQSLRSGATAVHGGRPDMVVVAFDAGDLTFRHEMDDTYKAQRSAMPDDLSIQIRMIRRILDAYNLPVIVQDRMEADDLMASVAAQAQEKDIRVFLCSKDKDLRQCLEDGRVTMLDLRRGDVIDEKYLMADWGIRPGQVVDFQALVGDSVDNVPGVPGVGPKTATKLLAQHDTLENVFDNIDTVPGKALKEKLHKGRESAFNSRELVRLRTDLPLPADWDEWRLADPDTDALVDLFAECGFHRFIEEIRGEDELAFPPPEPAQWDAEYVAVTTKSQWKKLLGEIGKRQRISFDLETTDVRPVFAEITGYAISWEEGKAHYVAVRAPEGETELDPEDVLKDLKPLLEDPKLEKVGQNLKYDRTVLRRVDVELQGIAFDTMLASYLFEPGERNHSLDQLSDRMLNHPTIKIVELIGKKSKKTPQLTMDQVEVAKVAEYAGEDADVSLRLTNKLEARLAGSGLESLYREVELPLVAILSEMEFDGIAVDVGMLEAMSEEYSRRLDDITAEIHELAGREFNLGSTKQLREVLFEEMKLPVVKRTRSGPSTDVEVLEELAERFPICAKLMEYRTLSKLKGTYVDALPGQVHPGTGRIHASFNQTVTATGRLSSSDPNLQNIPIRTREGREIRRAFVPAAGKALLAADYSQIELRLLAHYSGDAKLSGAFADDQDIHAAVAAQVAGVPIDQVDADMRRSAKAVNFGIMYGQSPFGLARTLKIPKDEAAAFIDAYFAQYPGIDAFFTGVLEGARKQGHVETILGRIRPIAGIKNVEGRNRNLAERTAINTVIQGSAADMIKKAMIAVHRELRSGAHDARLLLQIHDELVFEVAEDQVADFAAVVRRLMTQALPLGDVPLKVDVKAGSNWLELDPVD